MLIIRIVHCFITLLRICDTMIYTPLFLFWSAGQLLFHILLGTRGKKKKNTRNLKYTKVKIISQCVQLFMWYMDKFKDCAVRLVIHFNLIEGGYLVKLSCLVWELLGGPTWHHDKLYGAPRFKRTSGIGWYQQGSSQSYVGCN